MSYPNWTGPVPDGRNQQLGPIDQYPSYGYQAQYGAYPGPAAPRYGTWHQQPPDYRALVVAAVLGGVLFSLILGMPLGLIAQRNSRHVHSKWESGDQDGAARASRSARSWAIASIVFDVLGLLLVIALLSRSGQPTA